MSFEIHRAESADAGTVSHILVEAAQWLADQGTPMWKDNELLPERLADDVNKGLFFIARDESGTPAGVVKFQLTDTLFWPDFPQGDAAYVHRLAVGRNFAGRGVSTALLSWAVQRTLSLGRKYLRLDCEASRLRLRAVYEKFGFRHHSDRQVGPYHVARYEYPVS